MKRTSLLISRFLSPLSGASLDDVRAAAGDLNHFAAAFWAGQQLGDPVEFRVTDERPEAAARRVRLIVTNLGRDD